MTPTRNIVDPTPEALAAEAAQLEEQAREKRSIVRNIFERRDQEARRREAAYDEARIAAYDRSDWERRQAAARDAFSQAVADLPISKAWVAWQQVSEQFEHAAQKAGDKIQTSRLRAEMLDVLVMVLGQVEANARAEESERLAAERRAVIEGK